MERENFGLLPASTMLRSIKSTVSLKNAKIPFKKKDKDRSKTIENAPSAAGKNGALTPGGSGADTPTFATPTPCVSTPKAEAAHCKR